MTLQLQIQQMPGYLAARFTGVHPLYTNNGNSIEMLSALLT
jgi:hypothetical protein